MSPDKIKDLSKRFLRKQIFALKSNFNLKKKNQDQIKFRTNKVQD